jgi:hypothetical protein
MRRGPATARALTIEVSNMPPSFILFDTAMPENETIELTTDGGLTGRGVGSVRIEGRKLFANGRFVRDLTLSERQRLNTFAAAIDDFSGSATAPDAIHYRLRAGDHVLTWTDADRLPAPVQTLFDALWRFWHAS